MATNYQKRRQSLAGSIKADLIVLGANQQVQNSQDQPFNFRQDSNFYYLSGILEAGWILVIDVKNNKEWLIEPAVSQQQAIFDGAADSALAAETSGIKQIFNQTDGWQRLRQRLAKSTAVGVLQPPKNLLKRHHMLANPSRGLLLGRLKRHYRKSFVPIGPEMAKLRMIKDDYEIKQIESVAKFTLQTLNQLESELDSFKYEYEAEAFIGHKFRQHNFDHAYSPIVAGGSNATTLHYARNHSKLKPGDLLLIDVGATGNMYCADITRTYALGAKVPEARQNALAAVKNIQSQLISSLKPGITLKQFEYRANELIGQALLELGLINKIDEAKVRGYFPHAVSHFLGLDVHDVGDYSAKLEPGMVITVEPGIYDKQNEYGIRIEDDVLITSDSHRVLGYNGR